MAVPAGPVVFDTICPLYFTIPGHDDLLAERYGGHCYLPDEVRTEIERGEVGHGNNCARLLTATWWKPLAITDPGDQALFYRLLTLWGKAERNHGEAAAIVLSKRLRCTAIIDHPQGRQAAKELGIPIVGTVGVLARITAEGHLDHSTAWTIHQDMVAYGYRSPIRDGETFRQFVEGLR
jgi:predicted nucleic acid-binding protein